MRVIDAAALRPDGAQVALAAGLLAEVGTATAAELAAELRLPMTTVAAVLRVLERSGRAHRSVDGWETRRNRAADTGAFVAGRERLSPLSRRRR